MGFPFTTFTVVNGAGSGTAFQARQRGKVAGAQQPAVVAFGSVKVPTDPPRITRCRREPCHASEPVAVAERAHVTSGVGNEICSKDRSEPGNTEQRFSVLVTHEHASDFPFKNSQLGINANQVHGQGSGTCLPIGLPRSGRVLRLGGVDRALDNYCTVTCSSGM